MSAAMIVSSLLSKPSIMSLVGRRKALSQLPQNSQYPAIVYSIIDVMPRPNLAFQFGLQRSQARVQLNPVATSISTIQGIHAAIKAELDYVHHVTVAGKLIISCRLVLRGPVEKDNDTGLWTQPYDYLLHFAE